MTGALAERLADLVGAANLIDDPAERAYYGHDIAGPAPHAPALVVRPPTVETAAAAIGAVTKAGRALTVRGGGHSYTGGYAPARPNAVLLDLGGLNRIVAIDETDRWVTVEAGCTWAALYDALAETGLRTPFFGPLSGIVSTVGGAASQNAAFFGSARHGSMSASVLGLDVAAADGSLLRLGAVGRRDFARDFGPDPVGLFFGDCGALGVKLRVTMQLMPAPAATRFASFAFDSMDDLLAAQIGLCGNDAIADSYGFDSETHENLRRTGFTLGERAGALGDVARAERGAGRRLKAVLEASAGARTVLGDIGNSLHLVIECPNDASADAAVAAVATQTGSHGGVPIPDTIPRVTRARPFRPLKSLLGPEGEAWLPLHGLLPRSRAREAARAIGRWLDDHRADLTRHQIRVTLLTTTVRDRILLEPQFFWPDALSPFHRRHVTERQLAEYGEVPDNVETRSLVHRMRGDLARLFADHTATHYQIGKFYDDRGRTDAGQKRLIDRIKHILDPNGLLNPPHE